MAGGIETDELKAYVIALLEKYNKTVNKMLAMYGQYEDKKAEAEEKTGQDADTEAIAEQQEGIAAAQEQMSSLPDIILPIIVISKFPNIETPDTPDLDIPDISLPEINLQGLSEFVDFRGFLTELADKGTELLAECSLPEISMDALSKFDDSFKDIRLPNGMLSLPAFKLGSFPSINLPTNFTLPDGIGTFPTGTINLPTGTINLPNIDVAKFDFKIPDVKFEKPDMKKFKAMGGLLMKIKLMLGFTQCLSMIPNTFSGIEWPESFNNISQFFNIASIDVGFFILFRDSHDVCTNYFFCLYYFCVYVISYILYFFYSSWVYLVIFVLFIQDFCQNS